LTPRYSGMDEAVIHAMLGELAERADSNE